MRLLVFRMILGLHMLLAITWVGGVLFVGWGVYFAFRRFPIRDQRNMYRVLMRHAHWVFTLAGLGVVITGVLLGTWFDSLRSWQDVWTSGFGRIWLVALLTGLVTLIWGTTISYRHTMRVLGDDSWWEDAPAGLNVAESGTSAIPEDAHRLGLRNGVYRKWVSIALVEFIEILGFLVMIGCMVLFIT